LSAFKTLDVVPMVLRSRREQPLATNWNQEKERVLTLGHSFSTKPNKTLFYVPTLKLICHFRFFCSIAMQELII